MVTPRTNGMLARFLPGLMAELKIFFHYYASYTVSNQLLSCVRLDSVQAVVFVRDVVIENTPDMLHIEQ